MPSQKKKKKKKKIDTFGQKNMRMPQVSTQLGSIEKRSLLLNQLTVIESNAINRLRKINLFTNDTLVSAVETSITN